VSAATFDSTGTRLVVGLANDTLPEEADPGPDVFVLEPHRGRGLSKWMMDCIISHPDLQGLRRWILLTRDAHGLYQQFGFTPLAKPDRWMELWDPDVYQGGQGRTRAARPHALAKVGAAPRDRVEALARDYARKEARAQALDETLARLATEAEAATAALAEAQGGGGDTGVERGESTATGTEGGDP